MSRHARHSAALLIVLAACLPVPVPSPALVTCEPTRPITYHLEEWHGDGRVLHARFAAAQIEILEKINRCDTECLERLRGPLVVPDVWDADDLAFSPFPPRWDGAARLGKALIVDQPAQAFGAYAHGSLVRWGPISSGRKDRPTPPGLYHLTWRSPGRHSTVNRNWFMQWYFNIDNARGISLHAYALPGYPASHACVRLLTRDARWLFDWGEQWQLDARRTRIISPGTPVWIIGRYDYTAPPPWKSTDHFGDTIQLPPVPE